MKVGTDAIEYKEKTTFRVLIFPGQQVKNICGPVVRAFSGKDEFLRAFLNEKGKDDLER